MLPRVPVVASSPGRHGARFCACAVVLAMLLAAVGAQVERNVTYDEPQRLSAHLVFPRNSTYRAAYPFPIVFALANPAAFWPFDFQFRWRLEAWDPELNRTRMTTGGFEGLAHRQAALDAPGAAPRDPLLVINSTGILVGLTGTHATLSWSMGYSRNCSATLPITRDDSRGLGSAGVFTAGAVGFRLDDAEPLLDVARAGLPCAAQRLAVFRVDGEIDLGSPYSRVGRCPVVALEEAAAPPVPARDAACGPSPLAGDDDALRRSVSDYVAASVFGSDRCARTGGSIQWPDLNATSWEGLCKSAAAGTAHAPRAWAVVIVCLGVLVSWY